MKKLNLFLLIAFLLSSCAPAAASIPIDTPSQTPAPTRTATHSPTNTSTPTSTPTPLPITFIYQDNVPADERILQEQAAIKAYVYYSQYANLGSITIYTFEDINLYIDQIFPAIQFDVPTYTKSKFIQDWGSGGNTTAKDIVVIGTGSLTWKEDANSCNKYKIVTHELFHMLQSRLIRHGLFKPALDYGPEWLKEGSADVFGTKMIDELNLCVYSDQLITWSNSSTTANYSLKEVEGGDFSNKMQFWSLAPYAVDSLIKIAPEGDKSIIDYYEEIGNGIPWQESFKSAFNVSVEEFYSTFDSNRKQEEIDISVCVAQTDVHVKCLGRKPNKDYIFETPFIVTSQATEWKVTSLCAVTGWGLEGSDTISILQISVTDNTHGNCQVKVNFSATQQVIVDFVVP